MKIKAYARFKKCYENLTKKIKGTKGIWEARIDINYRISFEIIGDTIFLRVIGNHDEVLKKP